MDNKAKIMACGTVFVLLLIGILTTFSSKRTVVLNPFRIVDKDGTTATVSFTDISFHCELSKIEQKTVQIKAIKVTNEYFEQYAISPETISAFNSYVLEELKESITNHHVDTIDVKIIVLKE